MSLLWISKISRNMCLKIFTKYKEYLIMKSCSLLEYYYYWMTRNEMKCKEKNKREWNKEKKNIEWVKIK